MHRLQSHASAQIDSSSAKWEFQKTKAPFMYPLLSSYQMRRNSKQSLYAKHGEQAKPKSNAFPLWEFPKIKDPFDIPQLFLLQASRTGPKLFSVKAFCDVVSKTVNSGPCIHVTLLSSVRRPQSKRPECSASSPEAQCAPSGCARVQLGHIPSVVARDTVQPLLTAG